MAGDGAGSHGSTVAFVITEPAGKVLGHSSSKASFGPPNVSATALAFKFIDDVGSPIDGNAVLERPHLDWLAGEDHLRVGREESVSDRAAKL